MPRSIGKLSGAGVDRTPAQMLAHSRYASQGSFLILKDATLRGRGPRRMGGLGI